VETEPQGTHDNPDALAPFKRYKNSYSNPVSDKVQVPALGIAAIPAHAPPIGGLQAYKRIAR